MRRGIAVSAALLLLALATAPAAAQARPPNIVVIVADDLGYSDLGSYGGEIDTPVLDRLAFAGVRFNRFYATPRCSPTRAALLTGVWSHEAGVGHLDLDWGRPAYRGAIHDSVPTIAERLRERGYTNYMVGKWHLSPDQMEATAAEIAVEPPSPPSWPLQRGFDAFYGTLAGSGSYFDSIEVYDGNVRAEWPPDAGATVEASGASAATPYLTDVLGDRAASMVATHVATSPDRPFFLYLSFTAPHWPIQARPEDIEHYRGRYEAGWDELRAARFARERELGIVSDDAVLPPRDPTVAAWDETPDREWQARRMEVYAAMVTAMDRAVGRVVGALESAAALDDTLILFLSDNGACGEEFRWLYVFAPLVVKIPPQTSDGRAVRFGDRPDVVPGSADTYTTYGRGWAHLSNTPLRRYKHWTHEGGIAVPFFVHWPAQLAARAGTIVTAPAHVIDLVPTLDETARAGAAAPMDQSGEGPELAHGGSGRGELRGVSLWPLLRGEPAAPRTLYWEHEGHRAIAEGDWKLVSRWPFGWELYNLANDRSETDDLASSDSERVDQMAAKWNDWAAAVGVEQWPMVLPGVDTAISVALGVLVIAFTIGRARRARRSGAPPRTPGPFPGRKADSPPPPSRADHVPSTSPPRDAPKPIHPR